MIAQAFETERARDARGHAQGDPGRLDQDGPRPAERVQQRRRRVPACQGQHAGRQVFAQRGFALVQAPAALEQGFAGGSQVQGGRVALRASGRKCRPWHADCSTAGFAPGS
ncbi:hypothetical protein G6F65_021898 [Rhizopus arrhizus]|nr:hypothetical protein G6F65_021898 [Rhizopus arrhizus]